jgi:hypothetical protein
LSEIASAYRKHLREAAPLSLEPKPQRRAHPAIGRVCNWKEQNSGYRHDDEKIDRAGIGVIDQRRPDHGANNSNS